MHKDLHTFTYRHSLQASSAKMGPPSRVWLYFDEVKDEGGRYGKCKDDSCNSHISNKDKNTTSMWRHLQCSHPDIYKKEMKRKEAIEEANLSKKQKLDEEKEFVHKPEMKETEITDHFKKACKYKKSHPAQKAFERNVKNYIIHEGAPFRTVDSLYFKKVITDLDPRIVVHGRKKFSREIRREEEQHRRRFCCHCGWLALQEPGRIHGHQRPLHRQNLEVPKNRCRLYRIH
jgi:hypothetical protein